MAEISISMDDVRILVARNPQAAEQLTSIALERMVAERDAQIAVLLKRISENGEKKEPIGETAPLLGT